MGVLLGRYEVMEKIGKGGMGVVYRARAPGGKDVAIKVLQVKNREAIERFDRERRLQGAFTEREGFVPLLDSGVSPEGPYIVMPFLTGGTLRERFKRGAMSVEDSLALGLALARSLGHAHEKGIVHRDLKPDNVLFTGDGRPLVADLGLAKHFERDAPGASRSVSLTEDGQMAGTVGYLAPEQISDAKSATAAADVFALGAMLYECLAGKPAFDAHGLLARLTLIAKGQVAPLRGVRTDVPPRLEEIILRALASDPKKRFQWGGGLANALEEVAAKRDARRRFSKKVLATTGALLVLGGVFVGMRHPVGVRGASSDESLRDARKADSTLTARESAAVDHVARAAELLFRKHDAQRALVEALAATSELKTDRTQLARAYGLCALAEAIELQDTDALANAQRALDLEPKLAEAYCARGMAYRHTDNQQNAITCLKRAVELDPSLALAWAELSRADLAQSGADAAPGRDNARKEADEALRLDPTLADAWVTHALALSKSDKIDREAINDLSRAIELDPNLRRAWTRRAEVYHALHDYDRAISDFGHALALDPADALALRDRGLAYYEVGDLQRAVADYTESLRFSPLDPRTWLYRGYAKKKLNDRAGAIKDLERAFELGDERTPLFKEARGKLETLRANEARGQ